jgi:hypothetical protein
MREGRGIRSNTEKAEAGALDLHRCSGVNLPRSAVVSPPPASIPASSILGPHTLASWKPGDGQKGAGREGCVVLLPAPFLVEWAFLAIADFTIKTTFPSLSHHHLSTRINNVPGTTLQTFQVSPTQLLQTRLAAPAQWLHSTPLPPPLCPRRR